MIVIGEKVYKTKNGKAEIGGKDVEIPLSKFRVSSDRPDLLGRAGNNLEIEAVDETAAGAEFNRLNSITTDSSKHRLTIEVLEENRLGMIEEIEKQEEEERKALAEFEKAVKKQSSKKSDE